MNDKDDLNFPKNNNASIKRQKNQMLIQLLINGFIIGCSYSLIALGFALIYNTTRIFHFAHGAVYTLSAYLLFLFYKLSNLPLFHSIILSLIIIALLGIMIDELIYTPLVKRRASLLIQMLSSIGLYIIIINLIAMIFQSETKILSHEVQPTYSIGNVIITRIQLATAISFIIILALILFLLKKTYLGKAIRAMRDNPDLVSAVGMNPQYIRRFVFAMGSALAGVSAILSALDVGIDPHIGLPPFLNGAVAVIIGGIGFFEGATIGAIILGLLQGFAIWKISSRWQDAITFLVLIIFLLYCAEGIMGKHRRIEEEKV